MFEHKLVFSLIVLASFVSLGWVLIIYVLSFHAVRRLVDAIDVGHAPRSRDRDPSEFAIRAAAWPRESRPQSQAVPMGY